MRLHIHFGIHRTGTTSIHRALIGNRDVLKRGGVLYPDLGFESRHVRLAWHLISGKLSYQDAISGIKSEITADTQMIVLSSEDFCLVDLEAWLPLLASQFELTGSVYLKRQDLWLESWYNQHIKWPWLARFSTATPDQFMAKKSDFPWIEYERLLSRISRHIPGNDLYANTVERSSVENTTEDFFRHIGIPFNGQIESDIKNASLTSAKLDIVRRINFHKLAPNARRKIIAALDVLEVKEDNGKKIIFTDRQARSVMKDFSSSNRRVAEKYFGREKLFQDPYIKNRKPAFVSDDRAYKKYIPDLLKIVAQDNKGWGKND